MMRLPLPGGPALRWGRGVAAKCCGLVVPSDTGAVGQFCHFKIGADAVCAMAVVSPARE